MICRNCSAEIDDSAKRCPSCGKDPRKRNAGSKAGTLLTILLILSLGVNSYFISANFDEIKRRAQPLLTSISQTVSSLFKNGSSSETTTDAPETSLQAETTTVKDSTSATGEAQEATGAGFTEEESTLGEATTKAFEAEATTKTTEGATETQTSKAFSSEEETSAAKKPKSEKNDVKTSKKSQSTSTGEEASKTVYVTASGKCYHRKDCSYLSRSSSTRRLSLGEASRDGYYACSRCKP